MQKRESPENPVPLSANTLSVAQLAAMIKAIAIDSLKKNNNPLFLYAGKSCVVEKTHWWALKKLIASVLVIRAAKGC